MRKVFFIVLAIMLTACSAVVPKSEVERAREKWEDAKVSHYRFNLFIGCFCVYSQDMPLIVEVKDGQVISMQYQSGKDIEAGNLEYFQRFATFEKLFNEIENGFASKGSDGTTGSQAEEVKVTYDEAYGFPTQVSIDFIKNAVDDELGLTVSNFEKLP